MPLNPEDLIEVVNIAKDLDDDVLDEIGSRIVDRYDEDESSRDSWKRKQEHVLELAMQVMKPKTSPWPNSANIKYPLLTTAALNFSSSIYPALIRKPNLVKSLVIGEDIDGSKGESARRVERHMSYQLLYEMSSWEDDMDKGFNALPILGCFFKKTYFSREKGTNASDLVLPSDLAVNYWATSIEDAYSKTHIFEKTKNQIVGLMNTGVYREIELKSASVDRMDRSVSDNRQGISEPSTDTAPYKIIEQHTWYDLDNDGYEEPYIITVLYDTKEVLRVTARYDRNSITFSDKGKVLSIKPIEYFTKYGFIPSPDGGFYDQSYGHLLAPINNTINSSINQLLDAGKLYNSSGGFLSSSLKAKKGEIRIKPGQFIDVNSTIDDLRKSIMLIPAREPSAVTFNLLTLMIDAGQRMSATTDLFVGANAADNEKATTTQIRQEEGQKVFNGINKRTHKSLNEELRKLFRLNSIFLDDRSYFNVIDFNPEVDGGIEGVLKQDYDVNAINIMPAADISATAQQKREAKANSLLNLVNLGTVNPQEVTKQILEAGEYSEIDKLMTVQPQGEDPQLSLNRAKAEADFALRKEEIDLKKVQNNYKELESQTKSILNISKAESKEQGRQIEDLKLQLLSVSEMFNDLKGVVDSAITDDSASSGQAELDPQAAQAPAPAPDLPGQVDNQPTSSI